MTLVTTLVLMAASASVFGLAAWRSSQPSNPLKPRLVPWTLIVLFSGLFFMLLLAHVFSLFGLEPGRRFMPG